MTEIILGYIRRERMGYFRPIHLLMRTTGDLLFQQRIFSGRCKVSGDQCATGLAYSKH